jgi:hypothetical protein
MSACMILKLNFRDLGWCKDYTVSVPVIPNFET